MQLPTTTSQAFIQCSSNKISLMFVKQVPVCIYPCTIINKHFKKEPPLHSLDLCIFRSSLTWHPLWVTLYLKHENILIFFKHLPRISGVVVDHWPGLYQQGMRLTRRLYNFSGDILSMCMQHAMYAKYAICNAAELQQFISFNLVIIVYQWYL